MQISPYLNFPGTTEEVMTFYAKVLGGTLTEVHRFASIPGSEDMPEEVKNRVMHVGIDLPGGGRLMASDTMDGMGPPHVAGTNMSISIQPTSRAEADRVFALLAEGGVVGWWGCHSKISSGVTTTAT